MIHSHQRMIRRGASGEKPREGLLHTNLLSLAARGNRSLAHQTPALWLLLMRAHVVLVGPHQQVCPERRERGSSCGWILTCPQVGFLVKTFSEERKVKSAIPDSPK